MKDLNAPLLRYNQREQIQHEIDNAESMLPHAKASDKPMVMSSIRKSKKQLEEGSPVPLVGKEKDKLHDLEKKLRTKIAENMPTEEVMRKNPPGAVDWHQRWEKKNKKLIKIWKNIRIQLNPDSSDRDLCNFERYRPSGQTDRIRTDAQIVGLHSFTGIEDEQWPFDAPTTTSLEQAKRRAMNEEDAENLVNSSIEAMDKEQEKEDEQTDSIEKVDGRKRELTPEERALLQQRMAHAREVRKQKLEQEKQLEEATSVTE